MIRVNSRISLRDDEIKLNFIRSSGPGGQHVNTASTAVQLRFDAAKSPSLSSPVKKRLMKLAGEKMTKSGELILQVSRHRSQKQNRSEAIERLVKLVKRASLKPKIRRKTKPTAASKRRRLEKKKKRGQLKRLRKKVRHYPE